MIVPNYSIFGRKYSPPIHDKSLLDYYPGAMVAFSLRRLRSDYNGKCLKVRRSSDNQEAEFGFLDDLLDYNSIIEFCEGSTGYVVVWYNQAINGSGAMQAVASRQPLIVQNNQVFMDGLKPAVRFPGSQFLQMGTSDVNDSNNVILSTYVDAYCVNSSQQGVEFIFEHGNNANNAEGFYFYGSAYNAWIFRRFGQNPDQHSGTGFYWSGPSNSQILATLSYDGQGIYYKNGAIQNNNGDYGGTLPNRPFNGMLRIMASTNASYMADGKVQELLIYNKTEVDNRIGIESNINNFFNIY